MLFEKINQASTQLFIKFLIDRFDCTFRYENLLQDLLKIDELVTQSIRSGEFTVEDAIALGFSRFENDRLETGVGFMIPPHFIKYFGSPKLWGKDIFLRLKRETFDIIEFKPDGKLMTTLADYQEAARKKREEIERNEIKFNGAAWKYSDDHPVMSPVYTLEKESFLRLKRSSNIWGHYVDPKTNFISMREIRFVPDDDYENFYVELNKDGSFVTYDQYASFYQKDKTEPPKKVRPTIKKVNTNDK